MLKKSLFLLFFHSLLYSESNINLINQSQRFTLSQIQKIAIGSDSTHFFFEEAPKMSFAFHNQKWLFSLSDITTSLFDQQNKNGIHYFISNTKITFQADIPTQINIYKMDGTKVLTTQIHQTPWSYHSSETLFFQLENKYEKNAFVWRGL